MKTGFPEVFSRLRAIAAKHAGRLQVTADTKAHYCLSITHSPKLGRGFPVVWVKVGKNYVSYHFMPVYMFPPLRQRMSAALQARMQGKSCFHFTKIDEVPLDELLTLTADGLAMCRKMGFAE
jgi:hypothetical protein